MERSADGDKTAVGEAAEWLTDYLTLHGRADHKDIRRDGGAAGHSLDALKRARKKIGAVSESYGYPRNTRWYLPEISVRASRAGRDINALTTSTALTGTQPVQSVQSEKDRTHLHSSRSATHRPGLPDCYDDDGYPVACPDYVIADFLDATEARS